VSHHLRTLDINFLDDLFKMGGGYVLNFTDRTFRQFFAEELEIDIDDPRYLRAGRSKAKRLRCFLWTLDADAVVRTLKTLWEYREGLRELTGEEDWVPNGRRRFLALIDRLEGREAPVAASDGGAAAVASERDHFDRFKAKLIALHSLQSQSRGYAFETFLKEVFNHFGLQAREPFRLRGEQIDGSFLLKGETYLVEAKWQTQASGVADLHTFHGKVEQKAAWARGVFISYNGFTSEGLDAFGRGKKVICVDGFDIFDALNREIPLSHLLEHKVRGAAETGRPHIGIRELFP
jgi:hypothetical protein